MKKLDENSILWLKKYSGMLNENEGESLAAKYDRESVERYNKRQNLIKSGGNDVLLVVSNAAENLRMSLHEIFDNAGAFDDATLAKTKEFRLHLEKFLDLLETQV